jgi:hypothetical protein
MKLFLTKQIIVHILFRLNKKVAYVRIINLLGRDSGVQNKSSLVDSTISVYNTPMTKNIIITIDFGHNIPERII